MLRGLNKLAIAAAIGLGSSIAMASETDRLMELLVEKGILTTEEAEAIREEARAEREEARVPLVGDEWGYEPTAPMSIDEGAGIHVRRFGVETRDGSERFRIRGRAQLDAGFQNFSDDLVAVARESDLADYGVLLRRIRLGALGIMRERWEWQIEVDFAGNEVDLANAYMAYLSDHGRLAAGFFKEAFGMDYATSSRYISFIERAVPADAYSVSRNPGIMFETIKPNWYWAIGLFGNGLDIDRNVEEGWAVTSRGSFAPVLTDTRYVHLGAGINYRKNALNKADNEYAPVRLRTREGMRVIDIRLLGRDDIEGVSDFTRMNLEFAAGFNSWHVQSEYYRVDLNLDPDRGDVRVDDDSLTLDGWYVQGGYFLTGERRNYRAFSGDFGILVPNVNFDPRAGTWGAFEILFRYGVGDSREHSRPGRGQKLERYTLGLNWYMTPEVMAKFNVIYMEGERDDIEGDGWMYGLRLQYFF